MKKNDTAVVKIEDIGINGEGIGKADGYTLFIKDTVMGDLVEVKVMKAKKNYGYAKLLRVIEPSKKSCGSKMSGRKTVWRMSDPGDGLSGTVTVQAEKSHWKSGTDRRICAGSIRKDHAAGVWDGRAVSLPE